MFLNVLYIVLLLNFLMFKLVLLILFIFVYINFRCFIFIFNVLRDVISVF